jgi:hypothetical protein
VVLAILIIVGMMSVLLYFYQRTAETRQLVMKETEYISVGRLFLEKITSELRGSRVVEDQFTGLEGSSNSITFICSTLPKVSKWIVPTNETVIVPPSTDLMRVHYGLVGGTNLLEARGIERTEELLSSSAALPEAGTNQLEEFPAMTNSLPGGETNFPGTTNLLQSPDALLTDVIKYLQFRYWNGQMWTDSWSSLSLPAGVEVTIAQTPPPPESPDQKDQYPAELYRRVVYLPNSANRLEDSSATNGADLFGSGDSFLP